MADLEAANHGSNPASSGAGEITALRYTFVEMLFALAIAEVAVVASGIVRADGDVFPAKLPVIAHLILATVVIATSWLGWSASQWRRESPKVEALLSWNFVGLLLDVLLVIFYFILVRNAEMSPEATLLAPSAAPEARWIVWIFAVYVVWDIVSDVLKEKRKALSFATLGLAFACIACSVICVALAYLAGRVAEHIVSGVGVLLVDVALLAVVLLFRVVKVVLENFLHLGFATLRRYDAFRKLRQGSGKEGVWLMVFGSLYCIALGGAYLADCMST